jgi:sporulation protein YlmC with PRC-barrel domain
MLRNSKNLQGCSIGATDGTIGEVKDLYFDDEAWVIRYLVVSTGAWLANRKVLISPFALSQPQWALKLLRASLTTEQVKNSPDIDTDKPVSRQHEVQYLKYYSYPAYWGGDAAKQHHSDDPHLRSCNAVVKYHVHASDGDVGHVEGLLVDDETWAIRYLIVDTSNWWLGHQVLVAPQWIHDVNWFSSSVCVELSRKTLKDAPLYEPASSPDRRQEIELFEYYGRPGYWSGAGISNLGQRTP